MPKFIYAPLYGSQAPFLTQEAVTISPRRLSSPAIGQMAAIFHDPLYRIITKYRQSVLACFNLKQSMKKSAQKLAHPGKFFKVFCGIDACTMCKSAK